MEVHRLEREFLHNGVKLPDSSPAMTPEQVGNTYIHLYPEIATAAINGWASLRTERTKRQEAGCQPLRSFSAIVQRG